MERYPGYQEPAFFAASRKRGNTYTHLFFPLPWSRNFRGAEFSARKRPNGWVRNKRNTSQKLKAFKCLFHFLSDYCKRSSLHGLKYIVEPGAHWIDRLVWTLLFALSVIATVIVICKLSARFQAAETSTVVETLHYAISNLPFPSITLCPRFRVDWQKALEMEKILLPDRDERISYIYEKILTVFSTISFGDFDQLLFLRNHSLGAFDAINLTNLLRDVAPTCSELLSSCWWRNSDVPCCEIFERQRTEAGFCYSFNSETADFLNGKPVDHVLPRRSSNSGEWGGLRVTVTQNESRQPPDSVESMGIMISVTDSKGWPSDMVTAATGSLVSGGVRCSSSYATDQVQRLQGSKKHCIAVDESKDSGDYCVTMCRRRTMIETCGCSPFFMFPEGSHRDCVLSDFVCLSSVNDVFNNYVYSKENVLFAENKTGMYCDCLPPCEFFQYNFEMVTTPLKQTAFNNTIILDVHYTANTMTRYREDIVHTHIDLLVSFGGVFGLFVGGSILSGIEILYHITIGLISYKIRRSKEMPKTPKMPSYVKEFPGVKYPAPTIRNMVLFRNHYRNTDLPTKRY